MKQHELLMLISKYFSRFSEQVKILNANREFSINIHAENVLIRVLNIIFDADLENTNYAERKNYSSIDLRDKNKNFSIQITATPLIKKIKDTLEIYVETEHYKTFKKLYILILTGRQEKYSQDAIDKVTGGVFHFNSGTDIIDFSTLYLKLNETNSIAKILAVKELLESQFSDVTVGTNLVEITSFKQLCEALHPIFLDNGRIFKTFGPNSGADSKEQLRWDLTLWYKSRCETILPNNNVICNIISSSKEYILKEFLEIFDSFLAHAYAFEKHCEDSNFEYSQYLFPKHIVDVIEDECKK